ncbi:WD40/YVTN/BNR-like repeat-containing protein [Maribellus sediminis]|uniref:WD40/YVTN/BNR-like repeat-containing protein n=1 Tax=Maribellus sediminis TaxID=2696285 RepID=UPI0014301AC4|nr:hypothetical protein [Maribellus sediminis]
MKKLLFNVRSKFTSLIILCTLFGFSLSAQKLDIDKLESMKARSIGPAGMSGRIVAIDAVVANPDIIYAGAASGGVWKSEDGGITWNPIFDDEKLINIGAIKICQSNPDIIWVGTGEGNPRNSINIGGGLYKSMDAGKTWKLLGLEKTKNIHRILLDPRDENVAYIGVIGNPYAEHSERGLYKTSDGGDTFEKILYVDEKTGVGEMIMDPSNPNKLFVNMWEHHRWPWFFTSGGPGSGLYVTQDGGKNWTKLTSKDNGIPDGDLGRMGLAIAPSNPNVVYALIESKKNALYKSTDGGKNFKKINDKSEIGNRPFYYCEIYADPKDLNRLYSLHTGITMSEDGGRSFTSIEGGTHSDHHAMWINPENPAHLIEGNDGGMNISYDYGKTWRFVENLPVGQFYHINVDNELPYHVYGGMQDNGSWKGPGYIYQTGGILNQMWLEVMFGDGFDVIPDPDDARWGYAMSQQGNVGRYDSKTGNTYSIKPVAPEMDTQLRFHWNAAMAQDPNDNNTIYFGSQFVHKSTDKGLTWEIISPDLTTNDTTKQKFSESGGLTFDVTGAENHTCILTIAPSKLDKNVIWVGTDDGNLQVTRDGGKTWANVNKLPGLPEASWIPQVRASTYDAGTAWVVANNYRRGDFTAYAYLTNDFGKTWKRIVNDDKVFGYTLTILQDPVEPNLVFLGTEHGLWVSIDKGESWTRWSHGFPAVSTMDLAIQEREADLVIATFGRSIYILDDIRPLRKTAATSGEILDQKLAIFEPNNAIIVNGELSNMGSHFPADAIFSGENKPTGAQIKVLLAKEEKEEKESDSESRGRRGGAKADSLKVYVYDAENTLVKTVDMIPENGLNIVRWRLDSGDLKMPRRGGQEGELSRYMRRSRSSKTVLPGTYKLVAEYKDLKDSTELKVVMDPRIPKSNEVMLAQNAMVDELTKNLEVLYNGTERLIESKSITDKISTQLKGLEGDEIKALQKEVKAVQDSIAAIQDMIFGKQDLNAQGITSRDYDKYVNGKVFMAIRQITSRPGMPTATEERLTEFAKLKIKEGVDAINAFYENTWPGFRTKVEETQISLFKEYKPLELD